MDLTQALDEMERLRLALRFYADHDSWMSPPSGSGEDPIPPRYLVAQYGEPEGAGGWFHAEKALAPELSQELLKGLDVLADPEGH